MTVTSGASDIAHVTDSENPSTGNALEQFLLLAKSAKGVAAQHLVMQALGAPNTFVFGELMEQPHVKELESSEPGKPFWNLLQIYAFGSYKDYLSGKDQLPQLSDVMVNKLRRLSVVTLASKQKRIPYQALLTELDLSNVRELEDLVIEAIYTGMIRGKLDQRKQVLVVDYCMGRDVRTEDVAEMTKLLQDWATTSQCLIMSLDQQMKSADATKRANAAKQAKDEEDFAKLKKSTKTGGGSSEMEIIPPDVGSSDDRKKEKRSMRGLRGSAPSTKVWRNN